MNFLSEITHRASEIFDTIEGFTADVYSDIKEYVSELLDRVKEIEEVDDTIEEDDDNEEETSDDKEEKEAYLEDILDEIEEAQNRADEFLNEQDSIDEHNFPDFIDDETAKEIEEETGCTSWDDLSDNEKEYYHPEPDDVTDIPNEKEELADELGIPRDKADGMTIEELVEIAKMNDENFEAARHFMDSDYDRADTAKMLDYHFIGTFSSWEDFLDSQTYKNRLDANFSVIDYYINADGNFNIDVYEKDTE